MGIVSTDPGIILGPQDVNTYAIGLAGRVPLKVTTENGAIEVGDLLTSSSIPGVAMKATRPGPTVGKALEKLDCPELCQEKIIVFVNISFGDPKGALSTLSLNGENELTQNGNFNVAGDLNLDGGLLVEGNGMFNGGLTVNLNNIEDSLTINGSTGQPIFKVQSNGNIGIGTSSPTNTLSIAGSLCVTASGSCAASDAGTIYATNTTVEAGDV